MTLPNMQEPKCGTCATIFPGSLAIALARGWGYWDGTTNSGGPVEYIICRSCRTEGHKRPLKSERAYEDEPLF